jgi:hypothetical protein
MIRQVESRYLCSFCQVRSQKMRFYYKGQKTLIIRHYADLHSLEINKKLTEKGALRNLAYKLTNKFFKIYNSPT